MSYNKRNLIASCGILFVFAIINIVMLIIAFNKGEFDPAKFVEGDITESLAKIAVIIVISIAVIQIAFEVIVGLLGLLQAFGKRTGGFHIFLAWIMCIFLGISLILSIVSLTKGKENWAEIFEPIANFAVMVAYIYFAKKVKAEIAQ